MWKFIYQSVKGTSHLKSGQPCQDRCLATIVSLGAESALVIACADGAGTASRSGEGARRACRTIVKIVGGNLRQGLKVGDIDDQKMLAWYRATRSALEHDANGHAQSLRQFACTLLLAVVGDTAARFTQIGDGAIVILDEDSYHTVFWPQSGEYVNATNFLTDPGWERSFAYAPREERVDEIAVLTDGLQPLSLNYATKTAYSPFFTPMFLPLRQASSGASLVKMLRHFLDSPQVNERTDDDKSLVLATRVPCRAPDKQTLR